MNTSVSFLSAAIWIPILTGFFLLAYGRDRNAGVVRAVSVAGALGGLLATIPLYAGFDASRADMQFVEKMPWIERLGVNYHLGVDGISLWLVMLTAFITVIVVPCTIPCGPMYIYEPAVIWPYCVTPSALYFSQSSCFE